MAADEKGGVLQNCAIEGVLIETLWIKLKVGERWACVDPVDVVHNVTEAAKHTVATSRNLCSVLVHNVVYVNAALFCLGLFCLAEAVTIPAHDQTRLECQSLVLPNLWNSVAVYTDAILWVWSALIGVELVLPEAAAKYAGLTRLASANANHAQLAIATADNNRRTLGKAGLCCSVCSYSAKNFSALDNLAKQVVAQTALFSNLWIPGALLQAHDAGGAAV